MSETTNFKWHCQRLGGSDQATLTTMEELRHLRELDPKLWGALSCPATGLEFDKRTLELMDLDKDGRIRMPEVLDAVEWLCARVNNEACLLNAPQALPLAAIDETSEAGQRLAVTARTILKTLGDPEGTAISPAQVEEALTKAAEQSFNGDGIMPPVPEMDDDIKDFVTSGLAVVGGARDAGGAAGLNVALAESFVHELQVWQAWRADVDASPHPVKQTPEAWSLFVELREKIDDYFLRCQLAAFAPQANAPLNADERLLSATDKVEIDTEVLTSLPLARIQADADLPLSAGLNPIWGDKIKKFATLISPLLTRKDSMSRSDWLNVQEKLAPYGDALAKRPAVTVYPDGEFAPAEKAAEAIDALGAKKIKLFLQPSILERFTKLCEEDLASAAAGEDIREMEKLVLYYCHLHRLLMNFVSFFDFYTLRPDVIFRAGTLYIDGRSCQLCVPVDDVAKHSTLAAMSQLCLLYCECTRRAEDGTVAGTRTIMAALTAGGDDVLVEGRNGVFVDNTGTDWDACLVKVIHNPISFNQAMWAPYKRISRMVGEAVAKFATDKSLATLEAAKKGVANATAAPAAGKPAVPFDISKGVGIFAAVGIALGAIGTAIGSIAQALFSLAWWQFPLLIAGIFLIVSGPSVFLAWLKFRKRTLGPVLEASGWAVNSQIPVNLKLGSALTSIAKQPGNIERQSIIDPFLEVKKSHGGLWFMAIVLAVAIAAGAWLWHSGKAQSFISSLIQPQQQTEVVKKAPASKAPEAKKPAASAPAPDKQDKDAKADQAKDAKADQASNK